MPIHPWYIVQYFNHGIRRNIDYGATRDLEKARIKRHSHTAFLAFRSHILAMTRIPACVRIIRSARVVNRLRSRSRRLQSAATRTRLHGGKAALRRVALQRTVPFLSGAPPVSARSSPLHPPLPTQQDMNCILRRTIAHPVHHRAHAAQTLPPRPAFLRRCNCHCGTHRIPSPRRH